MSEPLNNILLVDDNRDITESIQEYCNHYVDDFSIIVTNSPVQAIDILSSSDDIQLLVTDIYMPEMSGIELIEHVKEEYPGLNFFVITAYSSETLIKEIENLGAVKCLEKPFKISEMVEIIRTALDTSSTGFEGFVDSMELPDIIQLMAISGKSSQIFIQQLGNEGWIFFENGELIHSEASDLIGEDAFKEIYSWQGGQFAFTDHDIKSDRTIFSGWQSLLLDAARQVDENLLKHAEDNPPELVDLNNEAVVPLKNTGVQDILSIEGLEDVLNTCVEFLADQFPEGSGKVPVSELPKMGMQPTIRRHIEFYFENEVRSVTSEKNEKFDFTDQKLIEARAEFERVLLDSWFINKDEYKQILLNIVGFHLVRAINPVVAISEFLVMLSEGEISRIVTTLPLLIEKDLIPVPYSPLTGFLDRHESDTISEQDLERYIREMRVEWEASIGPAKTHYALQRLLDLAAVGNESPPRKFSRELINLMHESRGMESLSNFCKLKLPPAKYALSMAEYKELTDEFITLE